MKQMLRDIKAAWPRERKFTWRGWVLVGVFVLVAVAGWRGWDPVYQYLQAISHVHQDWAFISASRVLIWGRLGSNRLAISILSIPAIFLALGLSRPRVHWAWYLVLIPLAIFMPAIEFETLVCLRSLGVNTFPGWLIYLLMALNAGVWGVLMASAMRNRWAVACVFGALLASGAVSIVLDTQRAKAPLFATFQWNGMAYGVDTIVFQAVLVLSLTWLAVRSWHVPAGYLCARCQYDRRGLKPEAACPECGTLASASR